MLLDELIQCWMLNCFEYSDKPKGYAAYFGASFMSHSCHPNVVWHFAGDCLVLHARRDIMPGDEVCISYLRESDLLKSAKRRKRILKKTKKFICTCERCGPGALEPDLCRGFRCPRCTKCAVFHPEPLSGCSLSEAVCKECGTVVGCEHEERLLAAEAELALLIKKARCQGAFSLTGFFPDEELRYIQQHQTIQQMLRLVGDAASGAVGPQHWLCDELWDLLADVYQLSARGEDACRMLRLRVLFQREGYNGLHGNLAWTLERQADLLLRQAGLKGTSERQPGLDNRAVRQIAIEARKSLMEGARILKLMFGDQHCYFTRLDRKRARISDWLATGILPAKRSRQLHDT